MMNESLVALKEKLTDAEMVGTGGMVLKAVL